MDKRQVRTCLTCITDGVPYPQHMRKAHVMYIRKAGKFVKTGYRFDCGHVELDQALPELQEVQS